MTNQIPQSGSFYQSSQIYLTDLFSYSAYLQTTKLNSYLKWEF
jgi:hypothetical protein